MKLADIHEASRRDLFRMFGSQQPEAGEAPPPEDEEQAGPNRRDFLRRTGGAAAMAAGQANPLIGAAQKALGGAKLAKGAGALIRGALDHLRDSDLLQMPEEEWIPKLSPQRLAKFTHDNPDHGTHEATQKITKILAYGFLKAKGVDPMVAKQMADTAGRASKALLEISKNWKLSQKELMDTADSMGMLWDSAEAMKYANFLRQNYRQFNIEPDLGRKPHPSEKRRDDGSEEEDVEGPVSRNAPTPAADYDHDAELRRWEGEGGATFEARLGRALGLLERRGG